MRTTVLGSGSHDVHVPAKNVFPLSTWWFHGIMGHPLRKAHLIDDMTMSYGVGLRNYAERVIQHTAFPAQSQDSMFCFGLCPLRDLLASFAHDARTTSEKLGDLTKRIGVVYHHEYLRWLHLCLTCMDLDDKYRLRRLINNHHGNSNITPFDPQGVCVNPMLARQAHLKVHGKARHPPGRPVQYHDEEGEPLRRVHKHRTQNGKWNKHSLKRFFGTDIVSVPSRTGGRIVSHHSLWLTVDSVSGKHRGNPTSGLVLKGTIPLRVVSNLNPETLLLFALKS